MPSLNKAEVIGNLGHDPEIRTMTNGQRVCNLSVATTEVWTDKETRESHESTEWHRVVIFNQKLVEVAEKSCRKGALVRVEGQLETRPWEDKQKIQRHTTEIVIRPFRGSLMVFAAGKAAVPAPTSEQDFSIEDEYSQARSF